MAVLPVGADIVLGRLNPLDYGPPGRMCDLRVFATLLDSILNTSTS